MPPEPFEIGAAGRPDQPRPDEECHGLETDHGCQRPETAEKPQVYEDQHVAWFETLQACSRARYSTRAAWLRPAGAGAGLARHRLGAAPRARANFSGAGLRGAYLTGADLYSADLRGADLNSADLAGAHLAGAHLFGAELRSAQLRRAHLAGAHLTGADFRGAILTYADLTGAFWPDVAAPSGWKRSNSGQLRRG